MKIGSTVAFDCESIVVIKEIRQIQIHYQERFCYFRRPEITDGL